MARYCGEVLTPRARDQKAPAASPDCHVDLNGEVNWNSLNLNAAENTLEHTVLKTMFLELKDECHRADVVFSSSMVDVADFATGVCRKLLPVIFFLMIHCGVPPRCPRRR